MKERVSHEKHQRGYERMGDIIWFSRTRGGLSLPGAPHARGAPGAPRPGRGPEAPPSGGTKGGTLALRPKAARRLSESTPASRRRDVEAPRSCSRRPKAPATRALDAAESATKAPAAWGGGRAKALSCAHCRLPEGAGANVGGRAKAGRGGLPASESRNGAGSERGRLRTPSKTSSCPPCRRGGPKAAAPLRHRGGPKGPCGRLRRGAKDPAAPRRGRLCGGAEASARRTF